MKSRVSSTVTKHKHNPRPRKYASASERQAAYRDRAPEVCFRAEPRTVETLDRIADTIDRSRAELLLSMTKFALTNHDWERFGLTHKTLPKYEGNPIMATARKTARKTSAKRTPTPAQLAARERFAEMARAGSFKKAGGRKSNPAPAQTLSGPAVVRLMKQNKVTIPQLAERMNITQTRIRTVREKGVKGNEFVRDWIEGITGRDPYATNPARKAAGVKRNPAMKKISYESSPNRGKLKNYVVRDMEDRNGMGSDVAQFTSKSDAMKYAKAYADKYNVQVSVRSV